MTKYYTRACNFYYGINAQKLIKKKLALPLCGNKNIVTGFSQKTRAMCCTGCVRARNVIMDSSGTPACVFKQVV